MYQGIKKTQSEKYFFILEKIDFQKICFQKNNRKSKKNENVEIFDISTISKFPKI